MLSPDHVVTAHLASYHIHGIREHLKVEAAISLTLVVIEKLVIYRRLSIGECVCFGSGVATRPPLPDLVLTIAKKLGNRQPLLFGTSFNLGVLLQDHPGSS